MNATTLPPTGKARLGMQAWWPVLLGLAVLYLPTWWDLARDLWSTEEQSGGPIVLIVAIYLAWQQSKTLLAQPGNSAHTHRSSQIGGWALLSLGLLFYILGRSQEILLFEVGSQIPVLFGILLITLGGAAARHFWFPILFLAFMVPLPGFMVDALTGPLKQLASIVAEEILHAVGYPIGRSGVTLTIGQYQLLVADACSGLHSIFSLAALGLFYLYQMRHTGWLRNGILLTSIIPIAIAANVVRVMLLIVITYHFGDAAGQGFAHNFASIVLFLAALMFLFALDGVLGYFIKPAKAKQ